MFESHTKSNIAAAANHQAEISNEDYKFVRELIYNETRINLGEHKRELVTARLGKRVRLLGMNSLHDYCRMLRNDPKTGELYHLIDAISTNHTFFFREVNHFNYLNETILPQFVDGKLGNSQSLKTWSCACSTGEEPYSVAITLAEYLERNKPEAHWDIQTGVHYPIALPFLDAYSKHGYDKADYPVAYAQMDHALSLPLFPDMTREQIDHVVDCIAQYPNK